MVHGQVGQYFPVEVDTRLLQFAHQFGIGHSMEAGTCVDTLNPNGAEVAFLGFAVTVCINETFFYCILGDGPNVFLPAEESFCEFEHLFALGAGCYMVH